ncbi:MAG: VWA domain-containing protein [Candidatus Gastranaerophilaceae bacterium]|nr:VWA domain-containing protein [Candidatus Gastranaerophilaceae bacterium]
MKKLLYLLIILFIPAVYASDYGVYSPSGYEYSSLPDEMTLFILDFSNSMSEFLEGNSKAEMMIETVKSLLPKINPNSMVGLRVYGHKVGFTPLDACRASSLAVPIGKLDTSLINSALDSTHPRGMTPITFSLKQAIKYDFVGFTGKKHIILLTDGGENCDESPCKFVISLMKLRKDVKIDVIAFNISDEEDLDQLQCTSLVTGGKFYTANTAAELARSLENSSNAYKKVEAKIIMK